MRERRQAKFWEKRYDGTFVCGDLLLFVILVLFFPPQNARKEKHGEKAEDVRVGTKYSFGQSSSCYGKGSKSQITRKNQGQGVLSSTNFHSNGGLIGTFFLLLPNTFYSCNLLSLLVPSGNILPLLHYLVNGRRHHEQDRCIQYVFQIRSITSSFTCSGIISCEFL